MSVHNPPPAIVEALDKLPANLIAAYVAYRVSRELQAKDHSTVIAMSLVTHRIEQLSRERAASE